MTTTLELPSTREEAWRWADIDSLRRAAESERAVPVTGTDRFLDLPGARLLFVDGVLDESASDLGPVQLTQIDASDHPLGAERFDTTRVARAIPNGTPNENAWRFR